MGMTDLIITILSIDWLKVRNDCVRIIKAKNKGNGQRAVAGKGESNG